MKNKLRITWNSNEWMKNHYEGISPRDVAQVVENYDGSYVNFIDGGSVEIVTNESPGGLRQRLRREFDDEDVFYIEEI